MAFNCPPRFGNEIVKSNKFPKRKESQKIESVDYVTEFAGMVYHKNRCKKVYRCDMKYLFDKKRMTY